MHGRTKFFLALLTGIVFLFGATGAAFGTQQGKGGSSSGGLAESLENSIPADVYQHKEKHRFEVKTRTHNEGDQFQVRVEERLEQVIREGIENEELTEQEAKGLEKRIAELEKKLAENPDDAKLLWKLAVAYRNVGDYDEAIAVLKKLQEQLPHPTAKVAVLLAQCFRAKGDKEAALAELEKLLASSGTVPGAVYAYTAILKEELGEVEEAAEDLEEAIAAEPKDEDLYKKIGELYSKAGEKGIKVFVKGKKPAFDAEPFIEGGRTMVPVRAVAEALGLKVDYKNGEVIILNPANGKEVVLYLGRAEARVDGRKVTLDVPAKVVPPGRTVVPLRFVSENLGANVKWFESGQVVAVNEQ